MFSNISFCNISKRKKSSSSLSLPYSDTNPFEACFESILQNAVCWVGFLEIHVAKGPKLSRIAGGHHHHSRLAQTHWQRHRQVVVHEEESGVGRRGNQLHYLVMRNLMYDKNYNIGSFLRITDRDDFGIDGFLSLNISKLCLRNPAH